METKKNHECTECGKNFSRKFVLKRHLESIHGKKWEKEGEILLNFISFSDFITWKECEEKKTNSLYVKARGQAIRKNGDRVIQYRCYRSGVCKSKGNGERQLKTNSSKKIGTVCPAHIWVKVINTRIFVKYCPKHENHDPKSEHLNWTDSTTTNSKKKRRKLKRNDAKEKAVLSEITSVVNEGDTTEKSRTEQHKDKIVTSCVNIVSLEAVPEHEILPQNVTSCVKVISLELVSEHEILSQQQINEHFISNAEFIIIKEELNIEDVCVEESHVEEPEFSHQMSDEVINFIPFNVNLVVNEEIIGESSNNEEQ